MPRFTLARGWLALLLLLLLPCPLVAPAKMAPISVAPDAVERGIVSYYHDRFHGRRTASGERFDQGAYSAAHKTLPFGTTVRVTRTDTGKSVIVRINDRGPLSKGRIIDLSRQAAGELAMVEKGLVAVKVEVLRSPADEG
jgi:rare lipoprotein A